MRYTIMDVLSDPGLLFAAAVTGVFGVAAVVAVFNIMLFILSQQDDSDDE